MDLSRPSFVEVTTPPGIDLQTYVIFRLNRWGVYVRWSKDPQRVNLAPNRVRSWWGPLILDRNVKREGWKPPPGGECPVDIEEALETTKCVMALPVELRAVIVEEYAIGGTQQQKAKELCIDRVTFWRRKERAHTLLLGLMNDAAAGLLE